MGECRTCSKPITRNSKTGLCAKCSNTDPEIVAKRAEARRRAFLLNPELRKKQRDAVAESNRQPHRRAQSGEQAKRIRLWEYGLPKVTDEVRQRAAQTFSERLMADIPHAHREHYKVLAGKVGAKEARRIILDHADKVVDRAFANVPDVA